MKHHVLGSVLRQSSRFKSQSQRALKYDRGTWKLVTCSVLQLVGALLSSPDGFRKKVPMFVGRVWLSSDQHILVPLLQHILSDAVLIWHPGEPIFRTPM